MTNTQFNPEQVLPLRSALGFTQSELADAVGVSQPTVALWEAGHRKPSGAATILLRQLQKKTEKKISKRG